ncbi:MAG: DUF2062 domain-containing protein [Verrucomicrobiaceae bacterium]|nr:DUF2062 domain-containing protein [Verrucomicrobiaceae bacterium]
MSFWNRWVIRPIAQQLTQGTSPHKISQALAFGLTLGIFPIIGSTTLLALLVGIPMKLNQPVLQAFKTLAYPLQWMSVLGFYRLGEMLYGVPHVSLSIPKMMERFFAEPGPFFRDYGMTAVYGITVWCLMAPALLLALYAITRPLIQSLAAQLSRRHVAS